MGNSGAGKIQKACLSSKPTGGNLSFRIQLNRSDLEAFAHLPQTDTRRRADSRGIEPAFVNPADRAIEKHPACAAPINSSGFVPVPSSKRDAKEY